MRREPFGHAASRTRRGGQAVRDRQGQKNGIAGSFRKGGSRQPYVSGRSDHASGRSCAARIAPTVASAAHPGAFAAHPDYADLCGSGRCQSRNFVYLCPRGNAGAGTGKAVPTGFSCRRKRPRPDQTVCDGPFWNLCEVASLLEFFNIRAVASFLRLLPGQKPCLNGRWKNGPAPHASPCAPPR